SRPASAGCSPPTGPPSGPPAPWSRWSTPTTRARPRPAFTPAAWPPAAAAVPRREPAYVLVRRRGGADPAAPGARTAGQVAAELARILPGVPVWRLDRGGIRPGTGPPRGRPRTRAGRAHRA